MAAAPRASLLGFRSASRHIPVGDGFSAPRTAALAPGIPSRGPATAAASPHFCRVPAQESPPAVRRLRPSPSPYAPAFPRKTSFTAETLDIRPEGFPPSSRYSFRHSPSRALHVPFRSRFAAHGTLPYRGARVRPPCGFGGVFEPRSFSARDLSASELLRTLSMRGCFWANVLAVP